MFYVRIKKIFKGCYINNYHENRDEVPVIENAGLLWIRFIRGWKIRH